MATMEPIRPPIGRAQAAQAVRRWQAIAAILALLALVFAALFVAGVGRQAPAAASGAASAVQATADPAKLKYESAQDKAEIELLKTALHAAREVNGNHRHHSRVMWLLLQGKITPREAWWRGGDSTCAGWLAANQFEQAVGRLKGEEIRPQPIPKEGLAFCKAARERK